jgi:hypothetical protein
VLTALVAEAVVVMWEVVVVVVPVGKEGPRLLAVVIPVALVAQLTGLEKEELEKKAWLEKIKLDRVFDPMEM